LARIVDLEQVLGAGRGRIEAAAGCGKTESVVQLVAAATGGRTLILTHTLAGVAALQRRLRGAGIPSHRYRLASIDSWCVHRVADFPQRAGQLPDAGNRNTFYPAVRNACAQFLVSHALDSALRDTYGRVLVDEYQDCGPAQHAVVCALANVLPTVVFGDPLQAVFHWRGSPVANWDDDVTPNFPLLETLDHPWRWERAGMPELGQWLIRARARLIAGEGIDLANLPAGIEWRRYTGDWARDTQAIRQAVGYWQRDAGNVLVMALPTRPERHQELARATNGVQVVENFDLQHTVEGLARLDAAANDQRLRCLLDLAHSVMTGIDVNGMITRCTTLQNRRGRNPADADETAALAFAANPTWSQAESTLRAWSRAPGRRVFRQDVCKLVQESLNAASIGRVASLREAAVAARERRRHQGRSPARRAVGSTLLLKGLEAEYAVLTDVEDLGPDHIYVALTRATRGTLIFSRAQIIGRRRQE